MFRPSQPSMKKGFFTRLFSALRLCKQMKALFWNHLKFHVEAMYGFDKFYKPEQPDPSLLNVKEDDAGSIIGLT